MDNIESTLSHNLYGEQEYQVSEGNEADLHKHISSCKKNPGHTKFIPADTFNVKHLPERHQDKDLYELIKLTAELTVRVNVNMTSPHRPKFWPNSEVPYPFYNLRDKTNLRTGSGMVSLGVNKFTNGQNLFKNSDKCWCKTCTHLGGSSHVWWEFSVVSATHVVFDDVEATHTSLKLFYDKEESPVVSVDVVSVDCVNIEDDWCVLKCVTCDHNLGARLYELWQKFILKWENVYNKFKRSRDYSKLSFIVSHPHGCVKQVSVGQWVHKFKVNEYLNKFTYTTSTCPGSSGAPVHFVGYQGWMWLYQLVHSGSLYCGLNYSGSGWAL